MAHPPSGVPDDPRGLLDLAGRPLGPSPDGGRPWLANVEPAGRIGWSSPDQPMPDGGPLPGPGHSWPDILPEELREPGRALLERLVTDGAEAVDELLPAVTPRLHWLRLRLRAVRRADGAGRVLVRLDDLDPSDDPLVSQVIRDPLTGCYSRRAFLQLAAMPERFTGRYTAALVAEVRRFRRINEVWGSGVGDLCLAEAARWLGSLGATEDVLFRLGGGRFLMLLTAASEVPAALAGCGQRPVRFGYRELQLSLQAGLADRTAGQPLLALADQADTALVTARRQAWRTVVRWTGEIAEQAASSAAAEEAVQQAVTAGAEAVLFQPVVDVAAGRVTAVEALVRLGGPAAQLPTERVLAASHKLGLTPDLASRVYTLAFTEGLRLRSVFPGCLIHVNVSREFLSTGLAVDTVLASAAAAGIALDQVVIELTEEVATELPPAQLFAELGRAAELGLQLAVDDFGRGETSLALLRRLPFTSIKLDRSLLPTQPDERGWGFVEGVVSLLTRLTGRIVAEGVETPAQSRRLRELGVHVQQGYLFAEPRDLAHWLAQGLRLPG